MTARARFVSSLALIAVVVPRPAGAGKSFLHDSDKANLMPDTKATCMVGGFVKSDAGTALIGEFQGGELSVTSVGHSARVQTEGVRGGMSGDGFVFVNVPKGPFRLSYLSWARYAAKPGGHTFDIVRDAVGKNAYRVAGAKRGDAPNEMSGTCNGGFIWLGEYHYTASGTVMPPSVKVKENLDVRKEALAAIKASLGASPWAAELDHPAANTPLPEGQEIAPGPMPVPVKPKIQVELTLLDPGNEDRHTLRYAPKVGDKRAAVFSTKMGPVTMQWSLDTVATMVNETSPIKYTFTVTKSSLPGQDGVFGFVQYDEQGLGWNNEAKFPPGKEPKIGPPMSAVVAVGNALVPLPFEAVGVGARWEAQLTAEAPTFTFVQTITYKLESVQGKQVKVSLAQVGKATFKQPIPLSGKMLVGNQSTGSGEATFNLDRAVAQSYSLATDTENIYGGAAGPHVEVGAPKSHSENRLESK